jgi:hypothetical protein
MLWSPLGRDDGDLHLTDCRDAVEWADRRTWLPPTASRMIMLGACAYPTPELVPLAALKPA